MPMDAQRRFGRLESLEPRSCWPDEARDLTPWVASDEGLKLLGEALDMDLACESLRGRGRPIQRRHPRPGSRRVALIVS
jgi:hypothetical protein